MHVFHIQTIQQILKSTKDLDATVSDKLARWWMANFCGALPCAAQIHQMGAPFCTGLETSFSRQAPAALNLVDLYRLDQTPG